MTASWRHVTPGTETFQRMRAARSESRLKLVFIRRKGLRRGAKGSPWLAKEFQGGRARTSPPRRGVARRTNRPRRSRGVEIAAMGLDEGP